MKPATDRRSHFSRLAAAVLLLVAARAAGAFTVSSLPQFVPSLLPPNIAVTLDDSGSMSWAYVPDSLASTGNTRRFKSASFNPLYYDPEVNYPAPVDVAGTPLTTSFLSARINGYADGITGAATRGSVNLHIAYRPTLEYDPSAFSQTFAEHPNVAADLTALKNELQLRTGVVAPFGVNTPGPAYYYLYDASLAASCTITNDSCYKLVIVSATSGPAGTDERQNFANWYSFYRTRNLLTVGAASRAFLKLSPTYRIAWQSLTKCNGFKTGCDGWDTPTYDSRIRAFDSAHRENFYKWLFRLPAVASTPLRSAAGRAGQYFTTSGVSSPYAADPHVTASPEYSCRLNFHILMTDGIWNSDSSSGTYCTSNTDPTVPQTCNNRDNTARTLPDGTAYSITSPLTRIYRDGNSNSLSDIAFHYWATDLRPDLPNNVVKYTIDHSPFLPDVAGSDEVKQYWNPKNDPANWQHLVTFTIGLGMTNILNLTSPDRRWAGATHKGDGYQNFLTGVATWPSTGVNVSPGNVYDLWHAAINSRGQAYAVDTPDGLGSALDDALTRVGDRKGASAAMAANSTRLSADSLLFQALFSSGDWTGRLRAMRLNADGSLGETLWEATDPGKIPAHGARNIATWSGSGGIAFTQADLTAAGLWGAIGSTALLDYLRGDQSGEQSKGGPFRTRSTRLGDIVGSDPAFVHAENYGYSSLPEGAYTSATPYAAFLAAKAARRPMLYVGANDGILHAFDALTGDERFAYVPNAVLPNLPSLANLVYAHRFFVDGSPAAWDAHFGGTWKTVLLGTTGAGGKAVFALDVTDPADFGPAKVLWEINAATPGFTDLGYTIGQAVAAKANNGEWVAIFGNGYGSTSQRAVLYIVRLADGALIRKFDTGVGGAGAPNGLGTPTLYDSNGDDVYDAVYAPDMRGNVWKFDLGGAAPLGWKIAFAPAAGFPNGAPLFTARGPAAQVQPIQARVELARPPAGVPGVMVLFGTGRFFADGDNADTTAQSFYGILDNGTAIAAVDRSVLQQQTISTLNITFRGVDNTAVRDVTANTIDWAAKRGWYIDLPDSGERVIGNAAVRTGRVIFNTVIPGFDPCTFGGSGWLMEVDVRTGAKLPYSVFDSTGDGQVNDADVNVAGVPITVGISKQPLVLDGAPTAIKLMTGTSGQIQGERNRSFGAALGRESWRRVDR
jgi:type IV pilus assembly protein PilY1